MTVDLAAPHTGNAMLVRDNPAERPSLAIRRRSLLDDDLVTAFARCWIVVTFLFCCFDFPRQLADGYTDGAGRPFGDDYVNYWSAAYLGRARAGRTDL